MYLWDWIMSLGAVSNSAVTKNQHSSAEIFPIFRCRFWFFYVSRPTQKSKEISVAFACVFLMTSFWVILSTSFSCSLRKIERKKKKKKISDVSAVYVIFTSMCDSFGIIFPVRALLPFHVSTRLYRFECKSSFALALRALCEAATIVCLWTGIEWVNKEKKNTTQQWRCFEIEFYCRSPTAAAILYDTAWNGKWDKQKTMHKIYSTNITISSIQSTKNIVC